MKILYIIDSLRAGGKERQLVELLKGLQKYPDIHCEIVLMSKKIHYQYIFNLEIKVHYLIRKWKKDPLIFLKFFKLCRQIKPDIIHSQGSMPSIYALPAVKPLNIKFVNAMIQDAPGKIRIFTKGWSRSRLSFPFSDVVISNSFAGLRSYNAPRVKSCCIHNGFDFKRLKNLEDKEKIREKFGIKTQKIVGMVASFSNLKDYPTFINSALKILTKRDDVTFICVGDGEKLEECERMVCPKFKDKILFVGKQKKIESIINVFEIGVLATFTEGISNSIMEYMALEKPVIATDGGGTKELVIDGETGLLVKHRAVGELVDNIEYLLDNPQVVRKMGNAGKRRIETEFSLAKMVQAYIGLYNELTV